MKNMEMSLRIRALRDKMLSEPRYASIEQARIITNTYKANEGKPRILQRALALKAALEQMEIWEGPLGTPLGLVHWKRASSPVEAGTAGYL